MVIGSAGCRGYALSDLLPKVCESCAFDDAGMVCKVQGEHGPIELDVASLPILKSGTPTRLQEHVTPERRIERVRVSRSCRQSLRIRRR